MILEQHYLGCLAQASYLVVDEESGVAAVVDPRRDVDLYVDRARELGARIERVLLTHFHADFLAGHLELAERTGATIHMGAAAQAEYEVHGLEDGASIDLGPEVRIEALETPGHTPESVCFLVHERGALHAVLTGDTLFIGDVGRPDLMASVDITAEELAGSMYDSLQRLLALPDGTLVYPGHGAGSPCGKNLSDETVSTIGKQRATNYALQPQPREEFVAALTAGQPVAPAYFPHTAGLNKQSHATLDGVLAGALAPLNQGEVCARQAEGATVLDVRGAEAFRDGHLPGSVAVGLDGNFASWCGRLLDLEAPIVLVAAPGEEREAVLRLGRIGLDRVVGYLAAPLEGGETLPQVDVRTAAAALGGDEPPLLVDVRFPGEVEGGHIEGALPVPLGDLPSRLDELPRDRGLLLQCRTGYRSMTAASLLRRGGFVDVVDVAGGIEAWQAAELPIVGAGCPS